MQARTHAHGKGGLSCWVVYSCFSKILRSLKIFDIAQKQTGCFRQKPEATAKTTRRACREQKTKDLLSIKRLLMANGSRPMDGSWIMAKERMRGPMND